MKKTLNATLKVLKDETLAQRQIVYGYYVTADGRVWSTRPKNGRGKLLPWSQRRELKPTIQHNGYRTVVIDRKTVAVHALVLRAFVGLCPEGKQCRHFDGDKGNNRLGNLAWGTCVEQAMDREKHGTKLKGSQIGNAVLTEKQVQEAKLLKKHFSYRRLAKRYGVSVSGVFHAIAPTGNNWRHMA